MILWWKAEFGEVPAKAAYEAVVNRRMTMGSLTTEFERRLGEILGIPHVVATANGTSAILLALLAAGVGPGDEVVVPNRTWIASGNAPGLLGANVVLAEVERDRPIMSPESFAAVITPRTKAVVPVYLNGRVVDIDGINAVAAQHGVTVIEDACQAIFSRFPDGKCVGTKSFAGCYSFSIGKPISCGQGGAVATFDSETARKMRLARTQGTSDITMAKWEMLGGNFRFWDLPAAVALTQLDLFEERKATVLKLHHKYKAMMRDFKKIRLLPDGNEYGEIPIYAECVCEIRDEFMHFLETKGIQARPFYASLNSAPQFMRLNPSRFPNSEFFAARGFTLPSGPDRSDAEIEQVFEALHDWERL